MRHLPLFDPPQLRVAGTTLADVRAELGDCRRCPLSEGRCRIVFGSGSPRARLFLLGEGPGHNEDATGEPFVGRAGAVLSSALREIGLPRSSIYITNAVKCRPPLNREPFPNELAACRPFLLAQLRVVDPAVVVPLGSMALAALLGGGAGTITAQRGKSFTSPAFRFKILPAFHPAYVLRNPTARRHLVEDLKAAAQLAGV